jgi:hypothetical protein
MKIITIMGRTFVPSLFILLRLLLSLSVAVTTITASSVPTPTRMTIPALRIFLLVGQSNMEGKGSIEHLNELLVNNVTKSTYQHYGTSGNYTIRDDVYIYFRQDDDSVYQGPLTVGYGTPHGENFGPELEFGWIVGDSYSRYYDVHDYEEDDEEEWDGGRTGPNVLLIKCAWGGKSLAVDFRPPSSGVGNYTHCDDNNEGSTTACRPYRPSEYGYYYRKMMTTIVSVLEDIPNAAHHRSYSHYEIAGLVWFQGWNDVINNQMVTEYGSNLANFIRDVRADLNLADLPVVIGELGQAGPIPQSKDDGLPHVELRRQMRKVTEQVEFVGTTRYVMTSTFVNSEGASFNGDYHYYGRADTEFYIGRAFGTAMTQLLEDYEPIVRNVTTTVAAAEMSLLMQ